MKDFYSYSSDNYAKYRPTYPQEIYDFLYPLLKDKNKAWDCGTGTGQVARELSKEFEIVEATDISQSLLDKAYPANNIRYSNQPAESTNFANNTFDLITVAQAVHWFDVDLFNTEVQRVGKPNSIIALIGYELIKVSPQVDEVILDFSKNLLGPFWDTARIHLEQRYQFIPFPFREFETPDIYNIKLWRLEDLIGYLNTWSPVKSFVKAENSNPVDKIKKDLSKAWGNTEFKKVSFPLIFKVGRVK